MNVQITARHYTATESLQERIREEVSQLEKFHGKITDCHAILDAEKVLRKVELKFNILGRTVTAHAEEENMGKALDTAIERVKRQLKKENEKLHDHKAVPVSDLVG